MITRRIGAEEFKGGGGVGGDRHLTFHWGNGEVPMTQHLGFFPLILMVSPSNSCGFYLCSYFSAILCNHMITRRIGAEEFNVGLCVRKRKVGRLVGSSYKAD